MLGLKDTSTFGYKNWGHMMEPVRAEQLNSTHPPQLPDIGIWRSPLTNRMMLTGSIGVSEELVTKELPLLSIHKSSLEKQNKTNRPDRRGRFHKH